MLEYVNGALDLLRNLPDYYNKVSLPVQQKIIGSIFSGRVVFQNGAYQTKGYNEVIEQICSLDKGLQPLKTELACENASQSKEVTLPGFKPGTY